MAWFSFSLLGKLRCRPYYKGMSPVSGRLFRCVTDGRAAYTLGGSPARGDPVTGEEHVMHCPMRSDR